MWAVESNSRNLIIGKYMSSGTYVYSDLLCSGTKSGRLMPGIVCDLIFPGLHKTQGVYTV